MPSTRLRHIFPIFPIFSWTSQTHGLSMGWILRREFEKLYKKNCGAGVCRKVTGNCLVPTNLMTFLKCSEHKAELFPYLSNIVVKEIQDRVVKSTVNKNK